MFIEHNNGWHTLPSVAGGEFLAMHQGRVDGLHEVFEDKSNDYGSMMCMGTGDGVVYITREQAKAFFGFLE